MTLQELQSLLPNGRPPPLLSRFIKEPDAALMDLLVGGADLGHLGSAEPAEILLRWLDEFGERGFRPFLDDALKRWFARCWGRTMLPEALDDAVLVTHAWCQATLTVAMTGSLLGPEVLPLSAGALRERITEEPLFLEGLVEGRARDPVSTAWLAVARHQRDRSLIDQWWRFCGLPIDQPWYRGECGLEGLRGLPPEGSGGGIPDELPEGLIRLAEGFSRRVDEGWLEEATARREWERIYRMITAAAYPFPDRWAVLLGGLQANIKNERVKAWMPNVSRPRSAGRPRPPDKYLQPHPSWTKRAKEIAHRLEHGDGDAVPDAEYLLDEQARYARRTGDTEYVVKSACYFARNWRVHGAKQALDWTGAARDHDPWNAHSWTIAVSCLIALGRLDEARSRAEEAVQRFPENPVVRTSLAEVLKAMGHLEGAESLYREAVHNFPGDIVPRTGLAEVLKAQDRLDEAESICREAVHRFPDDVMARNRLAEVLKARGHVQEAEALYRETLQLFPDDAFARSRLKSIRTEYVKPAGPGPAVYRAEGLAASPNLRSEDVRVILSDAWLLRQASSAKGTAGELRKKAQVWLERLVSTESRAASELGLAYLASEDLDDALSLLRSAVRRFPGSLRVRYALARAERERAGRDALRYTPETSAQVLQPWRSLERHDPAYRPLCSLGEGRALLNLKDGATVEQEARNKFFQLGRWVHDRRAASSTTSEASFGTWFAGRIHDDLFGGRDIQVPEELPDLAPIRERASAMAHELDLLEEEWVFRQARA